MAGLSSTSPTGMTSTQAVGKIRWLFNAEKAGHGGTLDPLASGLLADCAGRGDEDCPMGHGWPQDLPVHGGLGGRNHDRRSRRRGLGQISDTRPHRRADRSRYFRTSWCSAATTASYSAIKVDGERAYDLARAGEVVELAARTGHHRRAAHRRLPDPDHRPPLRWPAARAPMCARSPVTWAGPSAALAM